MHKTVLIVSLVAFSSFPCLAEDKESAMPFLGINRDPVTGAMGGASLAWTGSAAWSSFSNAAVLPFSETALNVGLSCQNWAPNGTGTSSINFGGSCKVGGRMGFSLGLAGQKGDEYDVFDGGGNAKGKFSPNDFLLNAGAGFRIAARLGMGLNVRYARQRISETDQYSAFCGDLFLFCKMSDLGLTAGLSNVGPSIKSGEESYPLPAAANAGCSWHKSFLEKHAAVANADFRYFFQGGLSAALGTQYAFKDLVFVRAGYHLGGGKSVLPSFASFGAGVKFAGLHLDIAWLTANKYLGNSLTVGLGYSF